MKAKSFFEPLFILTLILYVILYDDTFKNVNMILKMKKWKNKYRLQSFKKFSDFSPAAHQKRKYSKTFFDKELSEKIFYREFL